MQPYLFPYVGYFHLLAAADTFVFYDDVQYIQQGWINRNRWRGTAFTVPLAKASHRTPINERRIDRPRFERLRAKWLRGFTQAYSKAAHRDAALGLLEQTLLLPTDRIADLAVHSVRAVADYLNLPVETLRASDLSYDRSLTGTGRLLSLLARRAATAYINPVGGQALYRHASFAKRDIQLHFLRSTLDLAANDGALGLSILHALAHRSPAALRTQICIHYELL